jgi:hypothetical protein
MIFLQARRRRLAGWMGTCRFAGKISFPAGAHEVQLQGLSRWWDWPQVQGTGLAA